MGGRVGGPKPPFLRGFGGSGGSGEGRFWPKKGPKPGAGGRPFLGQDRVGLQKKRGKFQKVKLWQIKNALRALSRVIFFFVTHNFFFIK